MNKQSGLAPLIIILIVAAAVVGIVGGGFGGYRTVSKLKEAKQAHEADSSREPAAEISRETGTEPSTAQGEGQAQKEMLVAKKGPTKTSPPPPTYKTLLGMERRRTH